MVPNGDSSNYVAQTYVMILEALNTMASTSNTTATQLNVLSDNCKSLDLDISQINKEMQEILYEVKGYKSDTIAALKEADFRCSGHRSETDVLFRSIDFNVKYLKSEMGGLKTSVASEIGDLKKEVLTGFRNREKIYLYLITALVVINGVIGGIKTFKFFIP